MFYVTQIAYLYEQKALVDQLDVTAEFGGTLDYNHKNWVYNRLVWLYMYLSLIHI